MDLKEQSDKKNTFSQEEINNVNLPAEKKDNIVKRAYIWIIDRLKKIISKQNQNIEKKDNSSELTVDELDDVKAGITYEEIRDRILSESFKTKDSNDSKDSLDSKNAKKDGSVELNEEELDNVKGGIPYEDAKDKILKDINEGKSSLEDNDNDER